MTIFTDKGKLSVGDNSIIGGLIISGNGATEAGTKFVVLFQKADSRSFDNVFAEVSQIGWFGDL